MEHKMVIASRSGPAPDLSAQVRVLGLDPGWANFGYAIATVGLAADTRLVVLPERLGTLNTKPSNKKQRVRQANDDRRRGMELADALFGMVVRNGIRLLCAESPTYLRAARASAVIGRANGVIDTLAIAYDLAVLEVGPVELKKAVTGKGTASKAEIAAALWRGCLADYVLGSPDGSDHAYDALAAIVACASAPEVRLMLAAGAAGGPATVRHSVPSAP